MAEIKGSILAIMKDIEILRTTVTPTRSDGPARKKRPSLLAYSDDEDDEVVLQGAPEVKGCETELQFYLEWPKTNNVLQFWESNKTVFPRLYAITRKIFCVPATTAGVERLFSISGFILSSKRLSLNDENFKDQAFVHCKGDLPELSSDSRKRKMDG